VYRTRDQVPQLEGELAAFIYGVRKYEHILRFKEFRLVTDSTGLKHLQTMKNPRGIAGRWIEELQGYRYTVTHRPGRLNLNADNLSRSGHLPAATKEEEEEQGQWICELNQMNLAKEQSEDPLLMQVRNWMKDQEVPTREAMRGLPRELHQYRGIFGALRMDGELMVYRSKVNSYDDQEVKNRVLIPQSLRDEVFFYLHTHQHCGHFGIEATLARAKQRVYYPGMSVDLKNRVRTCGNCLQKVTKTDNKAGAHVPRRSSYPGELIYIDLIGPYEPSSEGFKYCLTVEDAFTRFAQIYKLRSKEAKEVARVLTQEHIATWGCPQAVHSDNGKEFTNAVFKELMEALQIKQKLQPPYSPWANRVERVHRVVNAALRTVLERDDHSWLRYLPAITLAYNSKRHSTTGISPFLAMFGREAKLPVDLVVELPKSDSKTVHEYVKEMTTRFQKIFRFMIKNEGAVIQRNSMLYGGQIRKFREGQRVWYLSPKKVPGKPTKHTAAWTGPWLVVQLIAEVLVKIRPAQQEGKEITVHATRLREYHGPDFGTIPKSVGLGNEDDNDDEDNGDIGAPLTRDPVELGIPVKDGGPGDVIIDKSDVHQDPIEEDLGDGGQAADPPSQENPEDAVLPSEDTDMEKAEEPLDDKVGTPPRRGVVPKRVMSSDTSTDRETRPRQLRKKRPPESKVQNRAGFKDLLHSSDTSGAEDVTVLEIPVLIGSTLPKKATEQAAGYDLSASEQVTIEACSTKAIDLNLTIAVPAGYMLQLHSRSGLARKGVFTVAGVVDPDYRGRVKCLIHNSNKEALTIKKGEQITCGLVLKVQDAVFGETAELPDRGTGGFGSTGTGSVQLFN
jgi:deoxyuridine 5'-triphosphate nucleotidohydrolase